MRSVVYEDRRGDTVGERGAITVAELLRRVPYLLTGGFIPPLPVVNAILGEGGFDMGMSGAGRWEPLRISAGEHAAVVADLEANGAFGRRLRWEQPPDWVLTRADWSAWIGERAYSIPAEASRRHNRQAAELDSAMQAAIDAGDEAKRIDCLLSLNELALAWGDFVQAHRRPRSD